MKEWKTVYFPSVEKWLKKLDNQQLISISKEIRLLELCGNALKLPHSKSLGVGLFELRERSYGLRIYYTYQKTGEILLLHGGNKGSQEKDIKRAKALLKQLKR